MRIATWNVNSIKQRMPRFLPWLDPSHQLEEARTAVQALSSAQQGTLAALTGLDDDGDGLTNTEEAWWCTDVSDADSDDDGG